MWAWIDDIRDLSRVNAARLEAWDDTVPLDQQPAAFVERHGELTSQLNQMQTRCAGHLEAKDLHLAKAKVLTSLHNHRHGLTDLSVFLPWQMTPERREELARPVPVTLPPIAGVSQELGEPEMADTS